MFNMHNNERRYIERIDRIVSNSTTYNVVDTNLVLLFPMFII